MAVQQLNLKGESQSKKSPFSSFKTWMIFLVMFIVPVISGTVYFAADGLVSERKDKWSKRIGFNMEHIASSKADAFLFWFQSQANQLRELTANTELQNLMSDDNSVLGGMVRPSMQEASDNLYETLEAFRRSRSFIAVYAVDVQGRILTSSADAPPVVASQRAAMRRASQENQNILGHARNYKGNLVVDVAIPVLSNGSQTRVQGAIGAVVPVQNVMEKIFNMKGMDGSSQQFTVLQMAQSKLYRILKDGQVGLESWNKEDEKSNLYGKSWIMNSTTPAMQTFSKSETKFGGEGVLPNEHETIAIKHYLKDTPYVLVYSTRMKDALSILEDYRRQIHIIAQLLTLTVLSIAIALWWRHRQRQSETEAENCKTWAATLEEQKYLLDGINNTVKEMVTLKTMSGQYLYANPAFSEFVGRSVDDIVNKSDKLVFKDEDEWKFWKGMDKAAASSRTPVFEEREVIRNGKKMLVEVSKTAIKDNVGKFIGIATVMRDITEHAKERKAQEHAHKNMISVMMSLLERHDKHLLRHTKYLLRLVKALAKRMKLKKADRMTLEVAATMSQIGKIYLTKELLDRHPRTPEEIEAYQEHINHAGFILDCVDWEGLPVVQTVYQMHEHLDGSGYPLGLQNAQITELARFMAVCNEFSNLVYPPKGEEPITPEAAVKQLKANARKFDINYIAKLTELIVDDNEILLGK